MGETRRIVAIASSGGHWQELRRLHRGLPADTIWVSTDPDLASDVPGRVYHAIPDANRWNKFALAWAAVRVLLLTLRIRPTHVVTTGAAPGLLMVIIARWLGARTLWVDSVANAEELSLSGLKARKWAHEVWTQWPGLVMPAGRAGAEVVCKGSVV